MRKERTLALTDEILMTVEKPARYIGGEVNSAAKDPESVDVTFVMCFPDVYEIGMSHLGIQILYDLFNRREDVYCDRVYSPWMDLDVIMREKQIPLFGVESQKPIKNFHFLGITLQYEMCYTNVLQILDLSRIPLLAKDRTEEDPLVIGGGPCTYNPEPLADFFDLFYIGEGETRYDELIDLYKAVKKEFPQSFRKIFLERAAQIPGIYVPSLYEVSYYRLPEGLSDAYAAVDPEEKDREIPEDFGLCGTIRERRAVVSQAPSTVRKEIVVDLDETVYPEKPLVPFIKATQERVNLEVMRGCIRGCRFCQAGMIYRPKRERSPEKLKELAVKMLSSTGYDEITLSSLSSSDYSGLKEVVQYLIDTMPGQFVNISLPSLRIDAFSLDVMEKVQDIRRSSLTFAPEAGTQRMRDVINKGLTEEEIINGAGLAFSGGWNKVKLYFMLGLPGETEEDIKGIPVLCDKIARRYYEIPKSERNGKVAITASTSFFVPKPFTPFQWMGMDSREQFLEKARTVRHTFGEMLNSKSLKYHWHEADVTVLEGVLARGDRRLSAVILKAYEMGVRFDAWEEYFSYERWCEAFTSCGLSLDFYNRERSLSELLPWDFIDCGVTKQFLKREWENAKNAKVTRNCQEGCSGCGCLTFKGGICLENQNSLR